MNEIHGFIALCNEVLSSDERVLREFEDLKELPCVELIGSENVISLKHLQVLKKPPETLMKLFETPLKDH